MSLRIRIVSSSDGVSFRDEADFMARAGNELTLLRLHGAASRGWSSWVPSSLWLSLTPRAHLRTPDFPVSLGPRSIFVAEHGARIAPQTLPFPGDACAILMPRSYVVDTAAIELGRRVTEPPLFPELITHSPQLLGPLLRVMRGQRPAGLVEDREVAGVEVALRGIVRRQMAFDELIARCPGKGERNRRLLFLRLLRARNAIEAHAGVDCPLLRLAEIARVSPTHFLRVYRRVFGMTPHDHALHHRLTEARRLLLTTDEPVAEIGRAMGFINRCAFARAFRAFHGTTPSGARLRELAPVAANDPAIHGLIADYARAGRAHGVHSFACDHAGLSGV